MSISINRNALSGCVRRQAQPADTANAELQTNVKYNQNPVPANLTLKEVAIGLGVPIVLIAYQDKRGIKQYGSYGLGAEVEFSKLTRVSHQLCKMGATVFPDFRTCKELSFFSGSAANDAARFYFGVPIRDIDGSTIGSISILQECRIVAAKGVSLSDMLRLGREFIDQATSDSGESYEPLATAELPGMVFNFGGSDFTEARLVA